MRATLQGRRRPIVGPLASAALLIVLTVISERPSVAAADAAPGTITTWAGGTGEGAALKTSVDARELATQGPYVYIADVDHDAIRVLDTRTGELRTVAGNGDGDVYSYKMPRGDGEPATTVRADQPAGVAVDAGGRVYFSDYSDGRVRRVDQVGTVTTFAGGGDSAHPVADGGLATGAVINPTGLAFDASGNLLVMGGAGIRRVSPAGIITTVRVQDCPCDFGSGYAGDIAGRSAVAVDPTGRIHIIASGVVLRIDDAGTLRRVAGGGAPADGVGDGGPATNSRLADPADLAFDAAGSLFVTENAGHRVRKIDLTGTITTVAGGGNPTDGLGDGGPAVAANLSHPAGIVVGPDGALYVSDTWHKRLRRISEGVITTVAGNGLTSTGGDGGPASKAQLSSPEGIVRDAVGNTYVAETGADRVRKIDAVGQISTLAGNGPAGAPSYGDGGAASLSTLSDPQSVAVHANGNVFIADSAHARVRRVDANGIITTVAGGGTGALSEGGSATAVELGSVAGVATDAAGNVYLSDRKSRRILKVTLRGTISTFAGGGPAPNVGGDGGPATSATLELGYGVTLAFDATGQLYISDTMGNSVRKVDLSGIITTVPVNVLHPGGVASDAKGSVYVTSGSKRQVIKLDAAGHTSLVAGTGLDFTALGDGGPAVASRLDLNSYDSSGLAFDAAGNLFVADTGNNRIRRIEAGTFEGGFHAVNPIRLHDTRRLSAVGPGATLPVQVGGRGIPDWGVASVVLNVTVTEPSTGGFLTAFPTGAHRPGTSNLNFAAGQTVANMVITKMGDGGQVSMYNNAGTTHVVVDLVGWYSDVTGPPGGHYNTLAPQRILDTRGGIGGISTPVGPRSGIAVTVAGVGGVPAKGVSAVVLNLTATQPSVGGFLAVSPSNDPSQESSNINFTRGLTVANMVTTKVGPDGKVRVYNDAGTTHVVIDVAGWFGADGVAGGTLFHPLSPERIVDSRIGTGGLSAPIGPGETASVVVAGRGGLPSSGVAAAVVNTTATQPSIGGYLTVFPSGATRPNASNLNFGANQTVPNLVVAKVGADGKVSIYNSSGSTHVILDVVGWYAT